jgi:hypothetical protein
MLVIRGIRRLDPRTIKFHESLAKGDGPPWVKPGNDELTETPLLEN